MWRALIPPYGLGLIPVASCVWGIPSAIWDNGVARETSGILVGHFRGMDTEAAWLWQMSGRSGIARPGARQSR